MASFIQRREENLKIAQSSQDYNTDPCFQKNRDKFTLKITTPNDISQLCLLSSLHYPTDPSGFSLGLLALPSPYRPSSLPNSARCLLCPHTHSLLHPIFSLTLPRVPQPWLHHPIYLTSSQQWAANAFSFHGGHRTGGEQRKRGR